MAAFPFPKLRSLLRNSRYAGRGGELLSRPHSWVRVHPGRRTLRLAARARCVAHRPAGVMDALFLCYCPAWLGGAHGGIRI